MEFHVLPFFNRIVIFNESLKNRLVCQSILTTLNEWVILPERILAFTEHTHAKIPTHETDNFQLFNSRRHNGSFCYYPCAHCRLEIFSIDAQSAFCEGG
jgi:hypothetical protein